MFQSLQQTRKQTDQFDGMHSFIIHYFLEGLGAGKMLERRKRFPGKSQGSAPVWKQKGIPISSCSIFSF